MENVIDEVSYIWGNDVIYKPARTAEQKYYYNYIKYSGELSEYIKQGYTKDPKSQKYIEEDGEYEE